MNNSPRRLNLLHVGYSVPMVGGRDDIYEGRVRITSKSEKIDQGVFYPQILTGKMEAITVDIEKDKILREYLDELSNHLIKLAHQMQTVGRVFSFEEMLNVISAKVAADFPYSHRMCEDKYAHKTYKPGSKYRLGAFMSNQDMVCRHMSLLLGAAIDYFKQNFVEDKKVGLKLKPDTEMRFMADMQKDLDESDNTGHAYLVVRKPNAKGRNDLFVIDPTRAAAFNVEKMFESKNPRGFGYYRYMFSTLRFLMQTPSPGDEQLINRIFQDAKKDSASAKLLKDVKMTLKDIDSMRRFTEFSAKNP